MQERRILLLGQFLFLQDRANFWYTCMLTCSDMHLASFRHCFLFIWASFWEMMYAKTLSFSRASSRDLFLNKYIVNLRLLKKLVNKAIISQSKKRFVSLNCEVTKECHLLPVVQTNTSFIIPIITLISYCCFISASEEGAEWAGFELVLSWHWLSTKSVEFFQTVFSTSFKNQNIYLTNKES